MEAVAFWNNVTLGPELGNLAPGNRAIVRYFFPRRLSLSLGSVFFSLTLCSSISLSSSLGLPLCVLSLFDVSYTPCRCHVSPVSRARSNEMCIGGRSSVRLKGRVLRSRDSPGEAGLPDKFQFRAVVQDFRASRTQTNFPSTLFLPCRD